jgi:hypothetical protein
MVAINQTYEKNERRQHLARWNEPDKKTMLRQLLDSLCLLEAARVDEAMGSHALAETVTPEMIQAMQQTLHKVSTDKYVEDPDPEVSSLAKQALATAAFVLPFPGAPEFVNPEILRCVLRDFDVDPSSGKTIVVQMEDPEDQTQEVIVSVQVEQVVRAARQRKERALNAM